MAPVPPPACRRPRQRPPHRKGPRFLGPFALALSLVAGAAVWAASGGEHGGVRLTTVLATVLLVQGLALLVAARWGRARGLVLPALLLTLVLAAVGNSDLPLGASMGDRTWVPATASQVAPSYSLGMGDVGLDLHLVDPGGGTVTTGVRLGMGDLRVTVPDDARVRITVHSAVGSIRLPDGSHLNGVGNDRTADLPPVRPADSKGTIVLDLEVGLGDVKVVRA
jgi:hypothetical protein